MFYGASEANNTVFFGTGSNVLVIPGGSSRNTVHALGLPGSNSVVFGGDYDSFNANLSFGFGSLLIRYGSGGGELHIAGFDPNGAYANPGIGTFQFTDRTLTYQELIDLGFDISGNNEANVLTGGSATDRIKGLGGNDTLQSGLGADVLEGGQGDDLLSGGMGNDTYVFNLGDGIDTIQDVASTGEGNRIQFGSGISQADLTFTHDEVAQTLTIQVGSSGTDKLLLTNFDLTGANGSLVVDTLAFADGSTAQLAALLGTTDAITGTPSNDVLTGTSGNDTIIGGSGNDTLSGGTGDDTYVFIGGDGIDTIVDTALPGEGNTLQFGTDITAADLSLGVGSLLIRVGTNGDALHLTNFDPANVLGPRTIETFQFADGTTLSYDQLIARGFDLTGTAGNDTLTGTNVVDRISGLAGDDTLQGGVGTDTLMGGSGNDTYVVDNTGDAVTENLNEGTDTVQSSLTYILSANVENLILTGASALDGTGNKLNNVLIGNDSTNVLVGGDGNDTLLGNAGNDILNGGIGLDILSGGDGNDLLYIDADDTSINGGLGHDAVSVLPGSAGVTLDVAAANIEDAMGGNGNDTFTGTNATVNLLLQGNSGNDTLLGGAGIDALNGSSGSDLLNGGAGADILVGGTGDDTYVVDDPGDQLTENLNEGTDTAQSSISYTLGANVENITLTGTANLSSVGNGLSNVLIGNSGDTVLDGGAGADTLIGGLGNDTYVIDNAGDVVTENLAEGLDAVQSSIASTLGANVENLTLTGTAAINGTGNSLNNVLIGNSASNTLTGGAGNDTLDGGVGNDTLVGGAGNDTYLVDARSDVVIELANGGTDQVRSSITYTLGSNLENLTLTSMSAINGTGNAFDNILTGNSGANVLTGGAGNDTYLVGAGDTVVENAGGGTDTVQSSVAWTLSLNVENLALTGTANINGTGNSANNVLIGNSGNNTLNGGSGNDTVDGGDGNDSLLGGSGDDTLLGGLGNDTLNAGSGNDVLNGGDGTDVLDGGSGDDQLIGGDGNDTLNGGLGADSMTGGLGDDTYVIDSLGDTITELAGEGNDTVHINRSVELNTLNSAFSSEIENVVLTGSAALNATGDDGNNLLTGNSAANRLNGGDGNDTLTGNAGNDTLNGGVGADAMDGGAGNDTYVVNSRGDSVTETLAGAAGGTDLVQSAAAIFVLGNNVENLTLTEAGNINGAGNALNNILTGNSGDNVLSGGDGTDTLIGGAGNDTLDGGAGTDKMAGGLGDDTYVVNLTTDVVTEALNAGTDNVFSSITYTLGANVENLRLTGTDNLTGTGNALTNILTGNSGNNTLSGLAGNDTLRGGLGNDTVNGGSGQRYLPLWQRRWTRCGQGQQWHGRPDIVRRRHQSAGSRHQSASQRSAVGDSWLVRSNYRAELVHEFGQSDGNDSGGQWPNAAEHAGGSVDPGYGGVHCHYWPDLGRCERGCW